MKRSLVIGTACLIAVLADVAVASRAVSLWNGLALAVVAFTVWFATRPYLRTDVPWPQEPRNERAGGRTDVAELSWTAFTRNGMVTERVLRRVHAIAARRLAAHGVLWDGTLRDGRVAGRTPDLHGWGTGPADAAEHKQRAHDLLGAAMLDELSTAHAATPRTLDHWLSALDALVAAPDDSRSTP